MRALAKKKPPAAKRGLPPPQPAQVHVFPAPTRGWVLNENLAMPNPGAASILENWVCTEKSIRARGGCQKYATLGAGVTAAFTYRSGATAKFFAATASAIYDITSVADPEVVPTAAVSGQTGGAYASEQFTTAGGDYLYTVNGADEAQLFDGASWQAVNAASSPIAVTGVATEALSHVWSYASRLFFVEKDTLSAWYLPIDSLGGAAAEFGLGGIFRKGGALLFGATWSQDSGAGLDDKCVFVSDQGEVAIYEGTNPGSASDWRLAGVYDITPPLGAEAVARAGGDLLIATKSGLVGLSQALQRDVSVLGVSAISAPISPHWTEQANASGSNWSLLKWPEKNILLVSQPHTTGCLVANLQTGTWSRFTAWDAQCMARHNARGFFGAADGCVYEMEIGGSDDGAAYTCTYIGQHEALTGGEKTVLQMRPIFQSSTVINPQTSVIVNYGTGRSAPPAEATETGTAGWDVAKWDAGLWDDPVSTTIGGKWASIGRSGWVVAPELQLTFDNVATPNVELVSIDATYETGAVVT